MNCEPSSATTSSRQKSEPVDHVRDPHVERLLEHHAFRDVHEKAVLPDGGVVRRELLVPTDELVEARIALVEQAEGDALGRTPEISIPSYGDPQPSPATSKSSMAAPDMLGDCPPAMSERGQGRSHFRSVNRQSFVSGCRQGESVVTQRRAAALPHGIVSIGVWGVAVVEHQRVPSGSPEERHETDERCRRLPVELTPAA